MLGGKWRLSMLPWRYLMGSMLQWGAEASSLPMGEQGDERRLVLRLLGVFFQKEEEGYFNFTIHREAETKPHRHASTHLSTHTCSNTGTHFLCNGIQSLGFQRHCT